MPVVGRDARKHRALLREFRKQAEEITDREAMVSSLSDAALSSRAKQIRDVDEGAVPAGDQLLDWLAVAREAARRTVGLRAHDVQLIGALAMCRGCIAEMQTGEGKTLSAVLAGTAFALARRGVHILTANDYLASRDAEWMGPAYELLGFECAAVQPDQDLSEKRRAYARDVVYASATEAGFDYLRDHLAVSVSEVVQRDLAFVIIDEIDSILIDEARVPLVVAGGDEAPAGWAVAAARLAEHLKRDVHYVVDVDGRRVNLTEDGEQAVNGLLSGGEQCPLTAVMLALHATEIVRRDIDYIVRDGRIEHVDDFKGRVAVLRRWPDGFQAAVEAKEGIPPTEGSLVLSSITLQSYARAYAHICGMTATATPSKEEFRALYELQVVVVPPARRMIRVDLPDRVYANGSARDDAVVEEVASAHATGRPVLVGTSSVDHSERLAALVRLRGIPCAVLNARQDAEEARVIAQAGKLGAVTISTNMAGRGTDIRLGGDESGSAETVAALGGLYVIGTTRHESRRIDLQLRGRSGRQGDPGWSRFFVSLDDDLLCRYRDGDLLGRVDVLRPYEGGLVGGRRLRREIERAQALIDQMNAGTRHALDRTSRVVERQRRDIHGWREDVLFGRTEFTWLQEMCPDRWRAVRDEFGLEVAKAAARDIVLYQIDTYWARHLAEIDFLREELSERSGAAAEGFGGRARAAYEALLDGVRESSADAFRSAHISDGGLDFEALGMVRPGARWTYMVCDVPGRSDFYRGLALFRSLLADGFSR